jgi:hypothetical protein
VPGRVSSPDRDCRGACDFDRSALTHPEALAKALTEFFTPAQQPA